MDVSYTADWPFRPLVCQETTARVDERSFGPNLGLYADTSPWRAYSYVIIHHTTSAQCLSQYTSRGHKIVLPIKLPFWPVWLYPCLRPLGYAILSLRYLSLEKGSLIWCSNSLQLTKLVGSQSKRETRFSVGNLGIFVYLKEGFRDLSQRVDLYENINLCWWYHILFFLDCCTSGVRRYIAFFILSEIIS